MKAGLEKTICPVCNKGIVIIPNGKTFGKLVLRYGDAREIPEAERIEACKAGEKACLMEARHYEKLARAARKLAATHNYLAQPGVRFSSLKSKEAANA